MLTFYTEAESREADHGICIVLELKKLDYLFNIIVLLRNRDVMGLAKVGRKTECLANGCRVLVNIKLWATRQGRY